MIILYHDMYQVSVEVYRDTYSIVDQERYTTLVCSNAMPCYI